MIVLSMIVKNEAHVIARCLDSVREYINAAVILDTGSTDNTRSVIRHCLQGIPVSILDTPWTDFGRARSQALNAARWYTGEQGHAFVIDADEEFRPEPGFPGMTLRDRPYAVWQTSKDGRYLRPQLLNLTLPWRYEGAVHEYACAPGDPSMTVLEHCTTHGHFDSARNKQGRTSKLLGDAALLMKQPRTPRNVFYIAESFRGAGYWKDAGDWYSRRVSMLSGCPQEQWWSSLMLAYCMKEVGAHHTDVERQFQQAILLRPQRAESYIALARHLYELGRVQASKAVYAEGRRLPMTTDTLNVDPKCYRSY